MISDAMALEALCIALFKDPSYTVPYWSNCSAAAIRYACSDNRDIFPGITCAGNKTIIGM